LIGRRSAEKTASPRFASWHAAILIRRASAIGIRIDFDREWVHLRKSNTEPIIRIYSESSTPEKASALAGKIIADIKEIAGL
jgi:phosphomannomutase